MKIVKIGKSDTIFDSPIFFDFCQITSLFSYILFTNFYKLCKTFLDIYFIVFISLYIGPIILYEFINRFKRFDKYILHLNLLLN